MNQGSINRQAYCEGIRAGIPIGLGYFAVAFSLGIAAATQAGMTAFQAFLTSFLCNASAGQYAGFSLIAAGATLLEVAIMTLIANARYLLMSCALSQRMNPKTGLLHRLIVGFDVTDEIFAVTIARPGYVNPWFNYGAMSAAIPGWSIGTAIGVLAGDLMPARLVSALSVALYGMFLAVIIPPAKKDKVVAGIIAVCFAASYAASALPVFSGISTGLKTIFLTVILSSAAAVLFPRKQEEVAQ